MTHEQAHQILDRTKDGYIYPAWIIEKALWLTGDIDAHEAVRDLIKEIKYDKDQNAS